MWLLRCCLVLPATLLPCGIGSALTRLELLATQQQRMQRYAPCSRSSRCAASVRCGRRSILVPSFASPGEVHPTVRCQRSSRRTGQRGLAAGLSPPHSWAASNFYSPVGRRNEPSLRFGLLAFAPSARQGHKVCSRLRQLHGFFQCFRPGREEYSHAVEPVKGMPRSARWLRHP